LKGKQGIISAFKDIQRHATSVCSFGISGKLVKYLPNFREQLLRDIHRKKISWKLLYTKDVGIKHKKPVIVKYLPEEFESPIEVHIYADRVLQLIWEPQMSAILIKSPEFALAYKMHFDLLWNKAK